MNGKATGRREWGTINGVAATLIMLAVLVERIAYAPRPVRRLILWIMLRAESTAYSYVYWVARDCGMALQHPGPSRQREAADPEDALELGWWFRAVALALRDIQRRVLFIQSARSGWRFMRPAHANPNDCSLPFPQAPDTS